MKTDNQEIARLRKEIESLKAQNEYLTGKMHYNDGKYLNLFMHLSENVDLAIVVRNENELLFVNHEFEKIWGISAADAYKSLDEIIEMIHSDDRERVIEEMSFKKLKKDKIRKYRYRIIRKDGTVRWIYARSMPVFEKNGEIKKCLCIAQDITDEKENIELNQTLAEMLDIAPDSITVHDEKGDLLYANNKTFKLHGYTKKEFLKLNLTDIVVPESALIFNNRLEQILKKGEASFEARHKRKDGVTFPLEVNARLVNWMGRKAVLGIAIDVTEKKKFESAIIAAKEKAEKHDEINNARLDLINFSFNHSIDEMLKESLNKMEFLTGSCIGCFYHVNDEQNSLTLAAISTTSRENHYKKIVKDITQNVEKDGLWIDCLKKKKILIQDSYNSIAKKGVSYSNKTEIKKIILVPVLRGKKVNAIICFGKKEADYNQNDIEIVSLLSNLTYEILERKLIQEDFIKSKLKAEENEKQFRLLFQNMEQAFSLHEIICDKKNIPVDYRYVMVNSAFEKQTGFTAEQIIGRTVKEVNPNIEKVWIENFGRVAKTGMPLTFESYSKVLGKHFNVIVYSPKKGFFAVISTDVTQNKIYQNEIIKAKERAEESESYFKILFEKSPDYIIISNLQGDFIKCNESAIKLAGFNSLKEIQKYKTEDFFYNPDERPELINELLKNGFISNKEIKINSFNRGIVLDCLLSAETLMIRENERILITSLRDISDIKKQKEELKIAMKKAEESNRLKTAFIQNMSHEIRTPLNAINGFAGFLNNPGINDEKRKVFISIIQNSCFQLLNIVTNILTISSLETKQESVNLSSVNINILLVDLLTIFKQQSGNHNIYLYTKQDLGNDHAVVYVDKTKLTQILSNLISNAIKFTHEGFIEFGYTVKGKELLFHVKDTGIGIGKSQQSVVFERFRQADTTINKKYGGTGLGLAISKAFTELMGGKIWIESKLRKGTTVYFTIPYMPDSKIKAIKDITIIKDRKTVMVAEDEEYNYLYIEEILSGLNINVLHARNGREAIDIVQSKGPIDLILMDIKMPNVDGYSAALEIKKVFPEIPIIAQSAYVLAHEREKYGTLFNDFLSKPIKEADLESLLSKFKITN